MGVIAHYITRKYLAKTSARNIAEYPQLACYSFDLITHFIHLDGQYERDQLRFLAEKVFPTLPSPSTCLDVGANIGNHTVHFANHFENVIAFEPHPRNFALLSINTDRLPNVLPLNIGASSEPGVIDIEDDKSNLAASSISRSKPHDGNSIRFNLTKIDDVVEVRQSQRISFMKFDVEGHERQALEGAEATIRQHRPLIVLEVLENEIDGGSAESINFLRSIGYAHFYEPVANGLLGKMPKALRKLSRTLVSLTTGKHPSKAGRLAPISSLEKRSYLMILCAMEPLTIP